MTNFEKITQIKCCLFQSLTSSNEGTIAHFEHTNVPIVISHSFFQEITSSSYPGSLYFNGCNVSIKFLSVTSCHSTGGNEHFGNFCYLLSSKISLKFLQFYLSSFSTDAQFTGDSLIRASLCEFSTTKTINSTLCLGQMGGSPISSSDQNCDYKFFNRLCGLLCP